jgi:hypothetical protein
LAFLSRTEREQFNSENHSGRYRLWLSLFELSSTAIQSNLDGLRSTALTKSNVDPWDALKMVQLLCYHEMTAEAARLAEEISSAQNKTKRNESIIRKSSSFALIARGEVLIQQNNAAEALKLFKDAEELELKRVNGGESNTRDFVDTLAVADKIAGGLT